MSTFSNWPGNSPDMDAWEPRVGEIVKIAGSELPHRVLQARGTYIVKSLAGELVTLQDPEAMEGPFDEDAGEWYRAASESYTAYQEWQQEHPGQFILMPLLAAQMLCYRTWKTDEERKIVAQLEAERHV